MDHSRSFLFVTWEGGGNVAPVLGVARRLAASGHRVAVLTEPCLREAVDEIGSDVRFLSFTRHFTRTERTEDLVRDWEASTPIGALRRAFDNVLFGPARAVAEETARALDETGAEVLVADSLMMGSLVAAEARALPHAVLVHMPEFLPGPGKPPPGPGFLPRSGLLGRLRDAVLTRLFHIQLGRYLDDLNDARRALDLSPLSSAREMIGTYHRADLRLIQTTRAFDFPITPAPENVRYVGPVLDEPDWTGEEWDSPWPEDDDRPLVVVGLSSTFQDQEGVIRRIIGALGELDVRGLVTLGPAVAAEAFQGPPNVVVVGSAPHDQIFPHASAVVTHAGHGTVMRALFHGLPLVCLPMGRDQNDNAARVVANGAGVRLKRSAKSGRIRDAVRRVLETPSFRTKAERLGRAVAEDVAEDSAVHELEALACRGGTISASPETRDRTSSEALDAPPAS